MLKQLVPAGLAGLLIIPVIAAPPVDALVSFDPGQVELRRVNDRWQIWSAGKFLKDVGTLEHDAREVLDRIRQLQLDQLGTIGTRQPVMEYWLSRQQAPRGLVPIHQTMPLDRETLRVEQVHGQWCLRDARNLWFNFGIHEADARQALEVIERWDFGRIGYVGHPQPVMIYFLNGTTSGQAKPPQLAAGISFGLFHLLGVRQLTPPNLAQLDAVKGEERLPLDWRRVELKRDGLKWTLTCGSECLADFGFDESAARDALRAFQFYRFTEQCRIGRSESPLVYYLVNGQAPVGIRLGISSFRFRPDELTVRRVNDLWMICEGDRPLLRGGSTEGEARQAILAIQRYRFDHLCRIGHIEGKCFQFLVRDR
jgi:hypothetical protein